MKNFIRGQYVIAELKPTKNPDTSLLVLGAPDFSGSMRMFVESKEVESFKQGDRVEISISFKLDNVRTEEKDKRGNNIFIEVIKNKRLESIEKVD